MKEAATIKFIDMETNAEALAVVRYDDTSVAMCLSIITDGDIEVVMNKDEAKAVMKALQIAVGQE